MGDVAVAHASAPPLTAPAAAAVDAAADAVANATNAAAARATTAATTTANVAERFSPGGHALRARARAVNYNLKKSDFGGTPAWLKASSAAPDGGLAHGGGGRAERGVTSSKIPTAANAKAGGAGGGGRFGKAASTANASNKGKAPVFSVHARAAGEENAAAAAPAPHQRAPRARPHGLEFSRAALTAAGAGAVDDAPPHPAGRGGAASTSQASSGRGGVGGGVPLKRSSKPAVGEGRKRGRPANNAANNNHEVHWGSAPSPHRSYISYGQNNNNASSMLAGGGGGGYESPPQQPARNNARYAPNVAGGNNEVTAAAAVAASAAAAGVLRKVQDDYASLLEKYQRLKERRIEEVEALLEEHDAKVDANVDAAARLAEHWKAEAARQGARAAGAAATREELGKTYEALAAARSHAHELEARALAAEEGAAELRRELAAARLALEARPRADKGCQASLLPVVAAPPPEQMQHQMPQMQQMPPQQQQGFFHHNQQQHRGLAAAWCPEGDVASSALYLPPPQHNQRRQQQQQQQANAAPGAAAAAAAPPPPVAPQQQQHQQQELALGLVTAPGRSSRPGATLYFHAATGLRFEAAPTGNGGGEVLYTPIELGALATSLPVYMRQEVALSARDWPAFYGKVLQAVGAGAKAAARAKAAAANAAAQ